MKVNFWKGATIALWIVFMIGCQVSENKKALEGGWVMDKLQTGDYSAFGSQLGKPEFVFFPNGIYEIDVAGVIDTGRWELSQDTILLMKSRSNPEKIEQTLHIQQIDEKKLIYKSFNDVGQEVVVELIRL